MVQARPEDLIIPAGNFNPEDMDSSLAEYYLKSHGGWRPDLDWVYNYPLTPTADTNPAALALLHPDPSLVSPVTSSLTITTSPFESNLNPLDDPELKPSHPINPPLTANPPVSSSPISNEPSACQNILEGEGYLPRGIWICHMLNYNPPSPVAFSDDIPLSSTDDQDHEPDKGDVIYKYDSPSPSPDNEEYESPPPWVPADKEERMCIEGEEPTCSGTLCREAVEMESECSFVPVASQPATSELPSPSQPSSLSPDDQSTPSPSNLTTTHSLYTSTSTFTHTLPLEEDPDSPPPLAELTDSDEENDFVGERWKRRKYRSRKIAGKLYGPKRPPTPYPSSPPLTDPSPSGLPGLACPERPHLFPLNLPMTHTSSPASHSTSPSPPPLSALSLAPTSTEYIPPCLLSPHTILLTTAMPYVPMGSSQLPTTSNSSPWSDYSDDPYIKENLPRAPSSQLSPASTSTFPQYCFPTKNILERWKSVIWLMLGCAGNVG
ncbi:hypothetical protein JAAARDRAFT_187379 [Jaapia argillacea MUCL 33604]|uniref:Uncharacterized protein n=1 Tax=Jaapia argillacea MUCL 33604 TaxID=933084 RepID=A0A067QAB7_9AGAM|nr:hypothetical protein JAAARDRAFT_187379 [Jaapia argillacea MUCL 33604]